MYFYLDPVINVKTQGNVWLQEGDMLELQVLKNKMIHYIIYTNCILKQILII